MQWIVSASEAGQKLVVFLKNKLGPQFSSRQIKQGIENNLCQVNSRLEHFASIVLAKGDVVMYVIESLESPIKFRFHFSSTDIIYEDASLLIYNKPAGFASDGPEITHAMKSYGQGGWELLHRLDRETTGLLMFTRGSTFREQMVHAFKTHAVKKTYLALVDGIPHQTSGTVENYLGKIHAYKGQALWGAVPSKEGHHAITDWVIEQKGSQVCLIRCYPQTGRTHQIRVHLSEMGYPILGDKQYGKKFKCPYLAPRCLLHAYELDFTHPLTGQKIHAQAELPKDFKEALELLIGRGTT